jgi:hypothetical protein
VTTPQQNLAGWYTDPDGTPNGSRWWDGARWTDQAGTWQDGTWVERQSPPDPAFPPPATPPKPAAAPVASAAAASSGASGLRWADAKRFMPRRWWQWALLVIGVLIVIGALSPSEDTTTSSSPAPAASTSSAATEDAAEAPAKPDLPDEVKNARAYIKEHAHDINAAQVSVQAVQVAVALVQKDPSFEAMTGLAGIAQDSHDRLDDIRNNFALGDTYDGALGDAQAEVFGAVNELKNSMGAIVAYTGDPNPASLAHFRSEYQPAVAGWNHGIQTIWRLARKHKAPTV